MQSNENTHDFARQALILKALAHEARLKIVHQLGYQECTVGELAKLVSLDASTVSRHLSLMKSVGILASRRAGRAVIYRLAMPCVLNFFRCANDVLQQLE